MSLLVVVPTYSAFDYAKLAVESAAKTPGAVVAVIDDGSPDWPGERIVRGWLPSSVPFVIFRFDRNARSLTRSWNLGASVAREMGLEFVCFATSDCVFPVGWELPLIEGLGLDRFTVAGPVTNAPGHSPAQDVSRYLPGYVVSDDPDDIDETLGKLPDVGAVATKRLNGFCLFGRVDGLFAVADRGRVFDPSFPMDGSEDDLLRRAWAKGRGACVCSSSFVFHYRSVSRGLHKGGLDRGSVRLKVCAGCEKSNSDSKT